MSMSSRKFLTAALLVAAPLTSFAIPVDWHGAFGVDSTLISGYRRIKSKVAQTHTNNGSQEVGLASGNQQSASWQSYVLKLSPSMIINDAATVKVEMTTGYANGGYLGDSPQTDQNNANSVPLYHYNQAAGSRINIKKAFVELYSDTATYVIGRHTYQWGLGAIYNEGANVWDRHASSRDGITMKLKIGNFHVNPFWSKTGNTGLTSATDAREYGIGLLYDNHERDIAFGLIYALKSNSSYNTSTTSIQTSGQTMGEINTKVTDVFFKQTWGKFDVGLEIPLLSGDLGKANSNNTITSYSAKALLLQTNYKATDSWTFGLDAGQVSGHDGSPTKFGALYLNPNYQVANLLFRYNINAIQNPVANESVYDSYITNTRYLKLRSTHATEKWIFDTAIIYAKALETASAGKAAYNHTKNKIFTATTSQSDDLGTEIDLNATYKWNSEISVGFGAAYLMTGDYFSYTNDTAVKNEAKNSLLLQAQTSIAF